MVRLTAEEALKVSRELSAEIAARYGTPNAKPETLAAARRRS